ncbi:MAG: hypothetical protein GY801_28415 [bacterium]|nr:hypothetical protein [bacterium]
MNPLTTSLLGALFTLVGAGATVLMLELRGNPKDKESNQRLVRTHRVLGYMFVVIFLIMTVLMIDKAGSYQEELSPRAILHIALGLLLVPLLIIKISIVRRFKRLGSHLLGFGIALFLISFVLNGVSAGHYFLHRSDIRYVSLSERDAGVMDVELGRWLVTQKCVKCHSLERTFRSFKSEKGWTNTINRMAVIDAPNIRDFDAKQMIHYLITQQKERESLEAEIQDIDTEISRTLVEQKCSSCHTLDRVYKAEKTQAEWAGSIETMAEYAEDPEFLTEEEKGSMIEFLATQQEAEIQEVHSEIGKTLVEQKCSTCHTLTRVEEASKNQAEWAETIASMAEYSEDPEFLTEEERGSIIEYLTSRKSE